MAKQPDERVSLHQLDPVKALKALLAVEPDKTADSERPARDGTPAKTRSDDEQ